MLPWQRLFSKTKQHVDTNTCNSTALLLHQVVLDQVPNSWDGVGRSGVEYGEAVNIATISTDDRQLC